MIDNDTLNKILDMSRIEIDNDSKDKILNQVNDIIGYVEKIQSLDTSSIAGRESVFDEVNVYSCDDISPSLEQPVLRKYTKNYLDGYYAVPKIL